MNTEPKRKCSHWGFWLVIGIISFLLMISFILNASLFATLVGKTAGAILEEKGEDEFPNLTEKWSYGSGTTKTARISYIGVITHQTEDTLFGVTDDPVESILQQIRAATNDEDIKAIIMEIDSPGGEVTPSDEIYTALKDFKKSQEGRKVVVFVRDMAASGGYYMASAGDWIVAEPTAIIGSIGVIMETLNWKGLSEKIGLTDVTIKSVTNKDLLNPFREVNPRQVAILQDMVDAMHQRFFNIVQESRQIDPTHLRSMADGRIFTSDVALENKFIDEIGYWPAAINRTAELLGEKTVKVVRYEKQLSFFALLSQARLPLNRLVFGPREHPKMMYIWQP